MAESCLNCAASAARLAQKTAPVARSSVSVIGDSDGRVFAPYSREPAIKSQVLTELNPTDAPLSQSRPEPIDSQFSLYSSSMESEEAPLDEQPGEGLAEVQLTAKQKAARALGLAAPFAAVGVGAYTANRTNSTLGGLLVGSGVWLGLGLLHRALSS